MLGILIQTLSFSTILHELFIIENILSCHFSSSFIEKYSLKLFILKGRSNNERGIDVKRLVHVVCLKLSM